MASPRPSFTTRALNELGLTTLHRAPRDVKLLCAQRLVRLAAYGASTLVLVSYLRALGVSQTRAGLFMTLTLAGDVAVSLLLTLFADALGRRAVLALGAALMAGSGLVFALCGRGGAADGAGGDGGDSSKVFWVLLAAAVLGVISPSGNEIGPFRAVEESVVAQLTGPAGRADVYAWYSLLGTAGSAFGMMGCGWAVRHLVEGRGWAHLEAYRVVFYAYAALGVVKFALAVSLSGAVEAERREAVPRGEGTGPDEGTALLDGPVDTDTATATVVKKEPRKWRWGAGALSLLPDLSPESVRVIISLCILFAMDAFASGLAPLSWVTFFFRSRYNLDEGILGTVFFAASIISACSMIVASSLAKRFGNVNTMVFTHLPSSVFLALIPIPNSAHVSLLFLILRACSQSMDTAPRSAFMAAILLPQERTAVMGLINVVKTMAQSLGPLITGVLADRNLFWVSFVCAGSLKATYDLGLLAVFKNHEREKADRERVEEERRQGQDIQGVVA